MVKLFPEVDEAKRKKKNLEGKCTIHFQPFEILLGIHVEMFNWALDIELGALGRSHSCS